MPSVIYEKRGKMAYITLNRPKMHNALNRESAKELEDIWVDFRDDDDLMVAILSGKGKSFCSGADVGAISMGKWDLSKSLIFGDKPVIAPHRYEVLKPIIAAVHGYVLGAGMWLMLESDIRIAADDAKFGLPEPKVGIPTLFAPFLIDHLPRCMLNEMLFSAERMDAQRVYQAGLINKVVPRSELMKTAEEMADKLCENAPLALRAMKETLVRAKGLDHQSTVNLIGEVMTPVYNSEDSLEAKRAFKERRKPEWKGR